MATASCQSLQHHLTANATPPRRHCANASPSPPSPLNSDTVDPATTTDETTAAPVEPAAAVVEEEEPTVAPAAVKDEAAPAVPAVVEDEAAPAAADEPPTRRMRHLLQFDETEYVETEETEDDDESIENAPSAAPAMAPAP